MGRPPLGREDLHTTLHPDERAFLELLRQNTGQSLSILLGALVRCAQNELAGLMRSGLPLGLAFQLLVLKSREGASAVGDDLLRALSGVGSARPPAPMQPPRKDEALAPLDGGEPRAELPLSQEVVVASEAGLAGVTPTSVQQAASSELRGAETSPAKPPAAAAGELSAGEISPAEGDPAAAEVWGRLSTRLKEVVGPTHHRLWLEGLTPLRLEGEGLSLLVPGEHHKQELEEHFFDVIRDELASLGLPGGVFFEVRPPREEGRGGEPNVISDHAVWEAERRRRRAQRAGVIELNEERQKYLEALVEHALASGRQPGWVWHEFQRRYGGSLPQDVYAKVSRYMREKRPSYLSVWDPGPRD